MLRGFLAADLAEQLPEAEPHSRTSAPASRAPLSDPLPPVPSTSPLRADKAALTSPIRKSLRSRRHLTICGWPASTQNAPQEHPSAHSRKPRGTATRQTPRPDSGSSWRGVLEEPQCTRHGHGCRRD